MIWWIVGVTGALAAFVIAAWIHAVWAVRRIDSLHTAHEQTIGLVEAGRSEIKKLGTELKSMSDELAERKRAHLDEVGVLNAELSKARDDLAKSQTPDGVRAGLTSRKPT